MDLNSTYSTNATNSTSNCTVYITGAGPGDPDLLTLKAKEILEIADVIAYDNLVSNEILEYILFLNQDKFHKPLLIYVGKDFGNPDRTITQEKTLSLLLELSKDYKNICRLKGGDPNIFGRGGEEAIFLEQHGINFEFIPGVSSISGVPIYAGIPLTHRDCTSSFTVITAHEDPDSDENSINWQNFDVVNNTLVLLMGTRYLPKIIKKLITLGRNKKTPIAIIYKGTTGEQKTLVSTIENIEIDLSNYEIKHPSVIIIGEVVKYREKLNWFENKKLFGKRILITRSKEQSYSFAKKLIKAGAKPILCPIVNYSIIEKEIYNKDIVNNLTRFNWIFFTSQNTVKFFFEILSKNYFDSRALSGIKIASVGYKTNLELEKYNIKSDFIPKKFSMENLIKELCEKENLNDKKILVPTQDINHDIPQLSKSMDQQIFYWEIYHAHFIDNLDPAIITEITKGIDYITLFSSNSTKNLFNLIEKHNLKSQIKNSKIAVIGDETAKTAGSLFGKIDLIAEPYTEEGLIQCIENVERQKYEFKT